jgi:hypothetical protein
MDLLSRGMYYFSRGPLTSYSSDLVFVLSEDAVRRIYEYCTTIKFVRSIVRGFYAISN